MNGAQPPKRRRRAEAQKKAFEEFNRLQQEELAEEDTKEKSKQPEPRAYEQREPDFEESVHASKPSRPAMPYPNRVQQQVWDEADDDDDFDDYHERHSRKKRGGGCLIGVVVALVLVIVVFVLGWFVFPEK